MLGGVGFLRINTKTFVFIAERYGFNCALQCLNLSMVVGLGLKIINNASRYDGKHREILYKSAILQTGLAVLSTVVSAIFCKTFTERTIGLLASSALIYGTGVYLNLPQRENIATSLLPIMPYMMNISFDSAIKEMG